VSSSKRQKESKETVPASIEQTPEQQQEPVIPAPSPKQLQPQPVQFDLEGLFNLLKHQQYQQQPEQPHSSSYNPESPGIDQKELDEALELLRNKKIKNLALKTHNNSLLGN